MPLSPPERLEVGELNASNAFVSNLNLNDGTNLMMKTGSFKIVAPTKTRVVSENQRRWGGGREVAETTENATVEWMAGVAGETEQECLVHAEELAARLEANPYRALLLWQAPGVTDPTLYEMRGTATIEVEYDWATFEGALLLLVHIQIPVAPLAQGLPVKVYEKGSLVLPEVLTLTSNVPGDAPAKAEVTIETGTTLEESFITGASAPSGIVADSGHIYWINQSLKTIGRATIAGGSVEQSWLKIEAIASAIAIDSAHVYWGTSGGKIGRATIAGASIEKEWVIGEANPVKGLAVNASHVYWVNGFHIARAAIGGTGIENTWAEVDGSATPAALAITTEFIFYSALVSGFPVITQASLTTGVVVSAGWTVTESMTGSLAVGTEYLYFAGPDAIGRVPLTGGAAEWGWVQTASNPNGLGFQGSEVYWAQQTPGHIGRVEVNRSAPVFALLGWTSKPASGLAAAPFGLLNSSEGTATNWAEGTQSGARGGTAAVGTVGEGSVAWEVDPATMVPDSFSGELAVEVWGRTLLSAGLGSATLTLSAQPQDGPGYGAPRYTDEWGSNGRTVVLPEGTEKWRMTRLGTLHLVVNPLAPRIWKLVLEGHANAVAKWGVDYALVVPVTQRACSPSSKANNTSYPAFIANSNPTVKTVHSDLSAVISKPGKNGHPDRGLGGQLLEVPPGEVEMLLKLSSLVPDDPTASAISESLAFEGKVTVTVTPRWYLARTA